MFPFQFLSQLTGPRKGWYGTVCYWRPSQGRTFSFSTISNNNTMTRYAYKGWLLSVINCHPLASRTDSPHTSQGDMKVTGMVLKGSDDGHRITEFLDFFHRPVF
jgi:hypothetical protein